jgi:hypothetical protein
MRYKVQFEDKINYKELFKALMRSASEHKFGFQMWRIPYDEEDTERTWTKIQLRRSLLSKMIIEYNEPLEGKEGALGLFYLKSEKFSSLKEIKSFLTTVSKKIGLEYKIEEFDHELRGDYIESKYACLTPPPP